MTSTVRRERVAELIDEVGLSHRSQAMPWELSGGEMQRLAIARALITDPGFRRVLALGLGLTVIRCHVF